MRIIQVITAFWLGGAEEVAINLALGLRQRGHDSCVVAVNTPKAADRVGEDQKKRLSEGGVEFLEIGGPHFRLNSLIAPFRLASFCRAWKPDVVHSHTDIPDFTLSLARRITNIALARTIHNTTLWPTHHLMGWVSEQRFRDDLIVHISDGAKAAYRKLRQKYALPESRTQVTIPNGVRKASEKERFDRTALVRECGANAEKILFCFAGRFTSQKGFDILLDAFERLPEGVLNKLQLHAFGEGEEKGRYFNRVAEQQLPIFFHSPIPEIRRLFPAFDAVVMPSRFEGLPLVALESLAAGVPVIGTSAPGLGETLPPEWPLKVPVENATALGKLIADFVGGAFNTEQLRERAARWGDRFTVDKMVEAYDTAYRDYLSLKKGPHEEKGIAH